MKATLENIRNNTKGQNGKYTVEVKITEEQVSMQYNSIDSYFQLIVYQQYGNGTYFTVDLNINTKDDFIKAVKWQLKDDEVIFL